jgi:hypothetical protein
MLLQASPSPLLLDSHHACSAAPSRRMQPRLQDSRRNRPHSVEPAAPRFLLGRTQSHHACSAAPGLRLQDTHRNQPRPDSQTSRTNLGAQILAGTSRTQFSASNLSRAACACRILTGTSRAQAGAVWDSALSPSRAGISEHSPCRSDAAVNWDIWQRAEGSSRGVEEAAARWHDPRPRGLQSTVQESAVH